MSALLDFKASDSNENPLTIASGQDKCRCDEVYDHNLVSICTIIIVFLQLGSIYLDSLRGLS